MCIYGQSFEPEDLGVWSPANRKVVQRFLQCQTVRCTKRRFAEIALQWRGIERTIFPDGENGEPAYRLELVRHFIDLKRFDRVEAELLGVPANNPHGCVLKIQIEYVREGIFKLLLPRSIS